MSGILIPQILLIAFRKKLFDEIDERKIHRIPVPRLGGLVFTPVILFSVVLVVCFNIWLGYDAVYIISFIICQRSYHLYVG
jgi:UDP-N-acetylmuramyl pentapeptide phosphotransferase/UDP-N-acetylglucosamine-1-phosphate transferase